MVCTCLHRTEAEISDAVARLGLETFEDVAAAVLAGSGCTTCRPESETILEATLRAVPEEIQAIPQERDPGDRPENVDGEQAGAAVEGRTS